MMLFATSFPHQRKRSSTLNYLCPPRYFPGATRFSKEIRERKTRASCHHHPLLEPLSTPFLLITADTCHLCLSSPIIGSSLRSPSITGPLQFTRKRSHKPIPSNLHIPNIVMIGTWRRKDHVLLFLLAFIVSLSFANIHDTSLRRTKNAIIINCLNCVRGGGSYYESNQSYHSSSSSTLGDLDEQGVYRGAYVSSTLQYSQHQRPPPFTHIVRNYFVSLHQLSPTLFYGTTASLLCFILWQFQSTSHAAGKILRNHFVCSRYNVLRKKRFHAAVLSAFSHASLQHLAVNLYAFTTFGRSVKQSLASQGVDLWPFVFSASIFASLTFLAMDRGGGGSCIGLSGVTLALLAFDSLVYPSKELRMIVSFVPIQLPAYYLFLSLVGISIAGILGLIGGNVAHSTHLGGLLFGTIFYESFKRGCVQRYNYKFKKAFKSIK